jgi:hypothetical protein
MAQTAQLNININAQGAEKSVEQLNQSIGRAGGSAQSLRLELRKVTQELQGLEPGSARFAELSARAGQLRDQIADTAAVIQSQAGNAVERFGTALSNTVQIGVAGFQALNSVQVLFGSENEEFNKSIQKMTALLNLSQAIQTFGGLGDKITEIRAGFGLLATTQTATAAATTTATVALEGEAVAAATTAVATEGAAVATGGFAVALNALPLVAIITALGFAVTALVQYSSAADDAKKEDEKRKKSLEESRKAQEAETKSVVAASKDYVSLVFALKNTTAGTKERKKAIDELNNTYGTTFKNLQDEKAFQDQLNGSIKEYITLQVAKIKADINREKLVEAVKKQIDAEKAYNQALRDQKKQAEESGLTLKEVYDRFGDIAGNVNKTLKAYNDATAAVDRYSTNSVELNKQIVELTDNGKKYEKQTVVNTTVTNDNNDALERQRDIVQGLRTAYERQIDAEKELELLRKKNTRMFISGLIPGQEENVIDYTTKYYENVFQIEESYRTKQQTLVEQASQREIQKYEESILGKKVSEQDYYNARKKIIDEGVKNLTLTEQALYYNFDEERKKDVEQFENQYIKKEEIAEQSTRLILQNIEKQTLEFNKQQRIKDVEESKLTEEEKGKKILEIKKEFLVKETELIQKESDRQIKILEKQRELELINNELSANERKNINAKYDKAILDNQQATQNAIRSLTSETIEIQKTQVEQIQSQIEKYTEYIDLIAENIRTAVDLISQFSQQQADNAQTTIEDSINNDRQRIEAGYAAALISREEYDNQLNQLDIKQQQEELALKRKSFKQNKALNITNATMDGIRAVLSTFANTPGELIIKSIAAALAGAFAATQIALISRQQFTAADGGIVPGNGSGEYDTVPSMLAPGEAVINSDSTRAFLPLLSAINQYGGGNSFVPDLPARNQAQVFQPVFAEDKSNSQPIRAYVVENDITTSQKRINRIERSARF